MAYFEHTYNGSVAKFGTSKPDVYMYMRIHGNTYPDARYLEYYVTLGCYYAYRSAWTWKETNFVVGGVDHLNGTDLAFNASGGATDLKTVGPFRVDYGLDGNAGSVQLWGRLYNSSVLNKNTGKRYALDTRLDSVWYPFPWIPAATAPSVPGNQRLNGSTSLTVTERSQNFILSWNKPSGGTYGVAGYRLYWSKGTGWQHFATVENANQLSHTFNINTIYSSMPRGDSIGFQVQAYNSRQDSGHAPGMFDYNKLTLAKMSFNNISASEVSFYSAKINWSSNLNVKTVQYSYDGGNSWSTAQSNINTTSGNFVLSGRTSGTKYTVKVKLTAASDGTQVTKDVTFTTKATDVKVTTSNITPTGVKINWSSSVNINKVQWKLSTEADSAYKNAQTGLNTTSGNFTITSLKFNTSYTINVRVTGYVDGKTATTSTTLKTLDIARLTAVTKSWDVDKSAEITATNPGNCALQLYIDYYANNTWIALISRAPITLTNGKYGITLTTSEINMLYKRASGDTNAKFRFTLKSLYPNYLGEHSMETKITFPTKAWVRPDGTGEWKRALVWAKDSAGTWKQVSPWVDPANNKNWKKI